MKNLLFLILAIILISGCKKDELSNTQKGPIITISNNTIQDTVYIGSDYTLIGSITSQEDLFEVKIFRITQSSESQIGQTIVSFSNVNSYNFQIPITNITEKTTIKIIATDKNNISTIFNYTIITKPNNAPPVITFTNGINEASVNQGSSYEINGNIISEEGLSEVKYFKVTNVGETQIGQAVTSFTNANSYDFKLNVTDIAEQTVIKIMATDKKNQTSSLNFTIKVYVTTINSYNNIVLGAQVNSLIGGSFASFDGTVYNLPDAKANSSKVDIIFFYGQTNMATLSAPSNLTDLNQIFTTVSNPSTWATKNATKLLKNNSLNFEGITDGTAIPNVNATGAAKVSNVAVGDVICFRTASTSANPNKNGVLKVVAISGNTSTATITFNVKMEK